MELRNRTTGAVITDRQFRSFNPNVSFPRVLTSEILSEYGYDPILEGPQATVTPPYEVSVRSGIEEVNGQWFTKYIVGPIFNTPEDESTYKQRIDDETAVKVREERTKLLSNTDWTQLIDAPVDAAPWATYRQALRDITIQPGFPHNVTWPDEPTI